MASRRGINNARTPTPTIGNLSSSSAADWTATLAPNLVSGSKAGCPVTRAAHVSSCGMARVW
eukprot:1905942-Lingulodinium_polyedra.AAC.1